MKSVQVLAALDWFLKSTDRPMMIKVDDDVVFDPDRLDEILNISDKCSNCNCCRPTNSSREVWGIWGHIIHGMVPHRSGRWEVSIKEFPGNAFPSFAMGSFYILSREAAAEVLYQLVQVEGKGLVHLEDVAITGQLREGAGLGLVNAWTLIRTNLVMYRRDDAKRKLTAASVLRSVVVFLGQGGGDLEEKAEWVWCNVWGKDYTQIQGTS